MRVVVSGLNWDDLQGNCKGFGGGGAMGKTEECMEKIEFVIFCFYVQSMDSSYGC